MLDLDPRSFDVRRIREAMTYGPEDYKQDWTTVVALSALMAKHDPYPYQLEQQEKAMNRVLAYLELHPEEMPF